MGSRHGWGLLVTLLLALPANARAQQNSDEEPVWLSSGYQCSPAPLDDGFFAQAVASQIANLPLSSAAGAFTYNFDPATRTFQRRAETLGLRYVERADTLGRRHSVSAGLTTLRLSFGSIDGRALGEPFYTRYRYEDGRVLACAREFDIGIRSTTASGTYALRDTVDVTVVIPFTSVSFGGTSTDWIGNVADTERSVGGIGDVRARVKWNFLRSDVLGVAAHAEMRLPTGNAIGLVGTGRIHQRVGAVVSARLGALQWHGTFGYSFRAGGKAPGLAVEDILLAITRLQHTSSNELDYGAGAEWRAHRRITLSAELVGRYLKDNIRFREETSDGEVPNEGDPTVALRYSSDHLTATLSHVHLVLGVVGTKYNLLPNTVVTVHGVLGLSNQGLRAKFSPVVGVEYAF